MTTKYWLPLIAIMLVLMMVGCSKSGTNATPGTENGVNAAMNTAAAGSGESLTVFAASASKKAIQELADMYLKKTGTKIDATFGGSGSLLTQITTEHFGDVFIPASDDFIGKADKKGAVVKDFATVLAYLVPTILVAKGNPKGIKGPSDLVRKDVRVVLTQPKVASIGDVAQEILTKAGVWDKVEPKVASFQPNVDDTVNQLLLGEADVVIAYDVYGWQHVDKVDMIALSRELAKTRNIPAAVITWSKQPEAAKQFIAFLASEEGKAVFAKLKYTVELPIGCTG